MSKKLCRLSKWITKRPIQEPIYKKRGTKKVRKLNYSSYKSFKVQIRTTKGFSIVQIFENWKFIYLTLKANVYQQLATCKQKSSHRLNVFFYSSSSKYYYVHSIPTKDNLHTKFCNQWHDRENKETFTIHFLKPFIIKWSIKN